MEALTTCLSNIETVCKLKEEKEWEEMYHKICMNGLQSYILETQHCKMDSTEDNKVVGVGI